MYRESIVGSSPKKQSWYMVEASPWRLTHGKRGPFSYLACQFLKLTFSSSMKSSTKPDTLLLYLPDSRRWWNHEWTAQVVNERDPLVSLPYDVCESFKKRRHKAASKTWCIAICERSFADNFAKAGAGKAMTKCSLTDAWTRCILLKDRFESSLSSRNSTSEW